MNGRLKLLFLFLIGIMFLGVGYALLSDVLIYNHSVNGNDKDEDFYVHFAGLPEFVGTGNIGADVLSDKVATFTIDGLKIAGDKGAVTFKINNESEKMAVVLDNKICSGVNTRDFAVKCNLASNTIAPGSSTTLTVVVTLLNTPVNNNLTTSVTIQYEATPFKGK